MKLQVAFDTLDLEQSLDIAQQISEYVDILEVGTLLIYKYGSKAIEEFRKEFKQKKLLADSKIVDRGKNAATLFLNADVDWITVMAGTGRSVIHDVCATAHSFGKKAMLDLLDSPALGQSAMEAQSLGIDALLFHEPHDEKDPTTLLDKWDLVRGNSELPIHISAPMDRENIHEFLRLKPEVIVIGSAIVKAKDPAEEAKYFADLIKQSS